MIIDTNVYLGTWALRQVMGGTAAEALRMMDAYGIDKAFVSSMRGVMYRNPQEANLELVGEVSGKESRFVPFAVINPAYAGWDDDITDCFEELGFKGVKIHPGYHGYKISDEEIRPFFKRIAEMGILLSYSARMEEGIEHWALRGLVNPTGAEIDGLLNDFPNLNMLITDLIGFDDVFKQLVPRENLFIDISHLRRGDELEALARRFGAGQLVYGSAYPFRYPESPLMVLEYASMALGEREAILGHNAMRLMGGAM